MNIKEIKLHYIYGVDAVVNTYNMMIYKKKHKRF